MNKFFVSFFTVPLVQSITILVSYTFPLFEVFFYTGKEALSGSFLSPVYNRIIVPINKFYDIQYMFVWCGMFFCYLAFGFKRSPLAKVVPSKKRVQIIQACLLSVTVSLLCYFLRELLPDEMLRGPLGRFFSSSIFFYSIGTVVYCVTNILVGKEPELPILTLAANLNVQKKV